MMFLDLSLIALKNNRGLSFNSFKIVCMKKVIVIIGKSENNYMACIDGLDGFVCTAATFNDLKEEIQSGLSFHLEGMKEDGDTIPELLTSDFQFEYKWDVESLLFYYDGIFTRSALEKMTGINQRQLGHYATGHSKPRAIQVKKIEQALHSLGNELISVSL